MFEDVDVSLHQVQPALALLLTDPGCHHHDAGVCGHRVVWGEGGRKRIQNCKTTPTGCAGNMVKRQLWFGMSAVEPAFVSHYFGGFEEEAAVLQVHDLPLQLVLHHIHQSQLISQVLREEEVSTVTSSPSH